MKKMDLTGDLVKCIGKDVYPKTPGRAYLYLFRLVEFLEEHLGNVPHYYQGGFLLVNILRNPDTHKM